MTQPEPREPRSERAASAAEILGLCGVATAGFLAPTDWRWLIGAAVTGVCLFVLGFFGLAGRS